VVELLKQVNEDRVVANDKKVVEFETGDMVLLFDQRTPVGLSKKLVNRWKGPYEIVSKQTPVNYTINHKGKLRLVHVQRLRRFNADHTDSDEKYENEMSMAQRKNHPHDKQTKRNRTTRRESRSTTPSASIIIIIIIIIIIVIIKRHQLCECRSDGRTNH
jgi:hypothetical protein